MKKAIFFLSLFCSSLFASAQFSQVTDIDDLALIYIGSQHRPDWTKDEFRPYVMHTYPDGSMSWMFDGFLMIEFQAWNESGVVVSFGESGGHGAQKADWERLIRVQLGLDSGNGCRALDDLIDELIPVLGEPGHKHKVVLTLPVAEAKSGATWGAVNNVNLNFQFLNHRETAMKWYIDHVIELWNKAGFKHLELDGVYWTNEAFSGEAKALAQRMNAYYHQKGLLSYWIPYFHAQGISEWKDTGIDVAYQQPNYYFRTTIPVTQLDEAINDAWENDMGLEMEFEGYNYNYVYETKIRTKVVASNTGLYNIHPEFYQRLVDYIDHFEEQAVFEFLPIAYYSGFQAVYDFENSGSPKDKELMNRLATILNTRHVSSGFDVPPTSAGIEDAVIADRVAAYGLDGAIYIADDAGDDVKVYSIDGTMIYSRQSAGVKNGERLNFGNTIECNPGVYVVKAGNRSIKVAVR